MSCNITTTIREIKRDDYILQVRPVENFPSLMQIASVGATGLQIPPEQARQVAKAMLACADEMEAKHRED